MFGRVRPLPQRLRLQLLMVNVPPTKFWLNASRPATGLQCRCCSPAIAQRFVGNETVAEDLLSDVFFDVCGGRLAALKGALPSPHGCSRSRVSRRSRAVLPGPAPAYGPAFFLQNHQVKCKFRQK